MSARATGASETEVTSTSLNNAQRQIISNKEKSVLPLQPLNGRVKNAAGATSNFNQLCRQELLALVKTRSLVLL